MFDKRALSIDEQINLLSNRGLLIEDLDFARETLSNVSYFRLSGYWWSMQSDKENHIFKPNSKFSDVVLLYNFDTELRNLLFEVIEKIEISLRTKLIIIVPLSLMRGGFRISHYLSIPLLLSKHYHQLKRKWVVRKILL